MKLAVSGGRIRYILLALVLVSAASAYPQTSPERTVTLPSMDGSLKFAVLGDAGRGSEDQYELAAVMAEYHSTFPFETVLTTGDNIYGKENSEGMRRKFELPYRSLLDRGVKFHASLGNHDSSDQKFYPLFIMGGREYYRFVLRGVSFYALNTKELDRTQLEWLAETLRRDENAWRIAFFHHPPFSSGRRHGSDEKVRRLLHPLFVANGVDVVFNGHDHFYERIRPQDGIAYFISGAGGKVRKGNIRVGSPLTEKGFDADLSFMIVEIAGDKMHFQVVSRTGTTVDSGMIERRD